MKQNRNKLIETETKGIVARFKKVKRWVIQMKENIVNNHVIHLHSDCWLLELVG